MAQNNISAVSVVSTPSGGTTADPNSVYIIGDTIQIAIDYTDDLSATPGSPTLRFAIATSTPQNRTASCAQGTSKRLVCSYVVQEGDGDNDTSTTTITIAAVVIN